MAKRRDGWSYWTNVFDLSTETSETIGSFSEFEKEGGKPDDPLPSTPHSQAAPVSEEAESPGEVSDFPVQHRSASSRPKELTQEGGKAGRFVPKTSGMSVEGEGPSRWEQAFWEEVIAMQFEDSQRWSSIDPNRVYGVGALLQQLNPLLQERIGTIQVRGEISNLARPRSGHVYFSLKDAQGVLAAVMFRQAQESLDVALKDGMEVQCRGELALYAPRGKIQMVVRSMERVGIGELAIAFEKMKLRLRREGLFDAERKQPLPSFPRRIGLVTSPTGSAVRDLCQVLQRRSPSVSLLLASCQVQGAGAARKVVAAIEALNRQKDVDLIIVGRGGGSIEDLWTFNEESVVRAIAASKIPIISGVGHETDTTLADLVADLRAPTPSAAAELAVPKESELRWQLQRKRQRLQSAMQQVLERQRLLLTLLRKDLAAPEEQIAQKRREVERFREGIVGETLQQIDGKRERLRRLQRRLEKEEPRLQLQELRGRLRGLEQRLVAGTRLRCQQKRQRFVLALRSLRALSPLNVLERGYALVHDADGKVVRDAGQLSPNERIRVRLYQGEVVARVEAPQLSFGFSSENPKPKS